MNENKQTNKQTKTNKPPLGFSNELRLGETSSSPSPPQSFPSDKHQTSFVPSCQKKKKPKRNFTKKKEIKNVVVCVVWCCYLVLLFGFIVWFCCCLCCCLVLLFGFVIGFIVWFCCCLCCRLAIEQRQKKLSEMSLSKASEIFFFFA